MYSLNFFLGMFLISRDLDLIKHNGEKNKLIMFLGKFIYNYGTVNQFGICAFLFNESCPKAASVILSQILLC